MQISRIDDIEQFDKLRPAWDAVYSADDHAQIFVSWAWLRGWFEATPNNWFILAVRPNSVSPYIAFFPLAMRSRRLLMGGNPLADYTGFVCLPQYEEEVIAEFAAYVQKKLEWDSFHMKDVLDARLEVFLKCFSQKKFHIREMDSTTCSYIPLPNSWEQYLQKFLSSGTRRSLKYNYGKIKRDTDFHETQVQEDNLESQIETFLMLYQLRWGSKTEQTLNRFRAIFRRCFENNCLWLKIIWAGLTPIAGLAAFVDHQKKTFSYYISGFDKKFAKLSPGKVVMACGIRYAIEHGFQIYDFLRGSEDYKYSFGATKRFNANIIITRKSLQMTFKRLLRKLKCFLEKSFN